MATDNSAFSLRPVFIGWITLLIQLPLQLFFTFWNGGFFGGMSSSFLALNSRVPFIVFGAAAFVGIPVVAYVGKKLNYARTEYRFYSDRLEFDEDFFSINKKVIKFRDERGDAAQGCTTTHLRSRNDLPGHPGDWIDG